MKHIIRKTIIVIAATLVIIVLTTAGAFADSDDPVVSGADDYCYYVEPRDSDITQELQEALDWAGGYNDGIQRTVVVPEGTYSISGKLYISSYTTLDMSAGTVLVRDISARMDFVMLQNTYRYNDDQGYEYAENIKLTGGVWDDGITVADTSLTGHNAVQFSHVSNLVLSGVTFRNCGSYHLVELSGCKDSEVTDCLFHGFYECGKDPDAHGTTTHSEALQIELSSDYTTSGFSWNDSAPCQNITISGCTFKNYRCGVGGHHIRDMKNISSISGKNIYIKNCKFSNIEHNAINLYGIYNFQVSGCSWAITNKGSFTKRFADVSDSYGTVKNCSVSNSSAAKCDFAIHVLDPAGSVNILNNSLTKAGSTSIYVKGVKKGKTATISKNKVTSAGKDSIYIGSCAGTVKASSNEVKKAGDGGIVVSGSVSATIASNTISGSKRVGVFVYKNGKASSITGNKISSTGQNGIFISESAGKASVKKNTVTGSKRDGISVYLSKGQVDSNVVKTSKRCDITVGGKTSKGVSVTGNKMYSTKCKSNLIASDNCTGKAVNNKYKKKVYSYNTKKFKMSQNKKF